MYLIFLSFLVSYVGGRPSWPIQSERLRVDREIRSVLLILDLRDGKL